ncbi:DUF4149 domain-containing protein [Polynucleobacter sp. MWH-Jannik1A5]|uniref:DUF4149 domain-containing protein n=1 Tax=Polynucleobacter sp. MWH-Jannik1A5 TaxID=1855890 RepID=UPI001C0B5B33|nr:DUF4149 domain-containing protein [Polynucleobacter sp. MWH-Jannik1A5]MBU3546033.1 DUF4149 domain-containing protein [Polynucleobacter sp. MWH-Jannik1A5]
MVESTQDQYQFAYRFLRFISYLLLGGVIAQLFSCLSAYLFIGDTQAAGMVAHIVIQHLSYYILGCTFIVLSLANVLIKRGRHDLKTIRIPALMLILATSASSFLLIPRMDYLRETALLDGMPVALSPFANYFEILNGLAFILVATQIVCCGLLAWRLSKPRSS